MFIDELEENKITMPSNYIPSIESEYVFDSSNQPINKLLTSTKSDLNMQKTMTHDNRDEQENKKTSKGIFYDE